MNAILPGVALVSRGREFTGLTLALLYALAGQTAAIGLLLAPHAVPRWLSVASGVACVMVWIAGQAIGWSLMGKHSAAAVASPAPGSVGPPR